MSETQTSGHTRINITRLENGNTEVSLELDGQAVSRAIIIPMTIHVGAALVRMDGIGGVETDEKHRNRGYSRRVLEAAVRHMREGDATISTLYGIPNFYPKFGYATAGPEHVLMLPFDRDALVPLPDGWSYRRFCAEDLSDLQGLYERATRNMVGPLVRGSAEQRSWSRLLKTLEGGEDVCEVVLDRDGRIVAYAWLVQRHWWMERMSESSPKALSIGEVVAEGAEAAEAALSVCCRMAAEPHADRDAVHIPLPPEGPLALAAMLRGGRFVQAYNRCGGFMVRTLSPRRLMQALGPELALRARRSGLDARTVLRIRTGEGDVSLALSPQGVTVLDRDVAPDLDVEIPQAELARLSLGGYPPRDLLARMPNPPEERAARAIEVLFPRRYPHIYPADRF